ncbi:hypothetical protein STEG23_010365, partial [Scotinomys teguina]
LMLLIALNCALSDPATHAFLLFAFTCCSFAYPAAVLFQFLNSSASLSLPFSSLQIASKAEVTVDAGSGYLREKDQGKDASNVLSINCGVSCIWEKEQKDTIYKAFSLLEATVVVPAYAPGAGEAVVVPAYAPGAGEVVVVPAYAPGAGEVVVVPAYAPGAGEVVVVPAYAPGAGEAVVVLTYAPVLERLWWCPPMLGAGEVVVPHAVLGCGGAAYAPGAGEVVVVPAYAPGAGEVVVVPAYAPGAGEVVVVPAYAPGAGEVVVVPAYAPGAGEAVVVPAYAPGAGEAVVVPAYVRC